MAADGSQPAAGPRDRAKGPPEDRGTARRDLMDIKVSCTMPGMDEDLLLTLKALSDRSRLRIVGLLAGHPMAVGQLADALRLTPGTVVHHLHRLAEAGLVDAEPRPPYVEYRLRLERLGDLGRRLAAAASPGADAPAELPGPDGRPRPAFDAKVLRAFFVDGRLVSIPAQEKKRHVVLRYLAETVFEPARAYPEKEVNQRLALLHPDVASLRRYLVSGGYMRRAASVYELRPPDEWPA
jgi:DNA-binding HxlR family transcriptional regulator